MCRIRIRGPLSIHGTLLLLIALARTSCILEVLQTAASSNATHPNEIHCLRMERSGLMHFFLPHVPWIHQLPKWNWRSLHLFASWGHSCPLERKQMCTKLSVELLYSIPFLNSVSMSIWRLLIRVDVIHVVILIMFFSIMSNKVFVSLCSPFVTLPHVVSLSLLIEKSDLASSLVFFHIHTVPQKTAAWDLRRQTR